MLFWWEPPLLVDPGTLFWGSMGPICLISCWSLGLKYPSIKTASEQLQRRSREILATWSRVDLSAVGVCHFDASLSIHATVSPSCLLNRWSYCHQPSLQAESWRCSQAFYHFKKPSLGLWEVARNLRMPCADGCVEFSKLFLHVAVGASFFRPSY